MEPAMLYSNLKLAASALFFSITLLVMQGVLAGFIPAAFAQWTPIYTYFAVQNRNDQTLNTDTVYRSLTGASVLTSTHKDFCRAVFASFCRVPMHISYIRLDVSTSNMPEIQVPTRRKVTSQPNLCQLIILPNDSVETITLLHRIHRESRHSRLAISQEDSSGGTKQNEGNSFARAPCLLNPSYHDLASKGEAS
jgi:hypothetical protein